MGLGQLSRLSQSSFICRDHKRMPSLLFATAASIFHRLGDLCCAVLSLARCLHTQSLECSHLYFLLLLGLLLVSQQRGPSYVLSI